MLSLVLSLLLSQSPQAPPPSIRISGKVVTGDPPRPVAGATVRAGGSTATTDASGQFAVSVTPSAPGATSQRVTVSAPGYLDATIDVPIPSGMVEIGIRPNSQVREDVVVSAPASEPIVAPPTLVVAPAEVRAVAGSADNVFHVLQTLPGVSATNEFGSRLTVRGGGPDENLTVMDGVEIHDPYRLFGLTSAFNPETIDRFELTAGGFSAQYGDRLSSLLIVENRPGDATKALSGSTSMSITDANVVLEGRLPRRANGSWLVTGRRTYYDVFAERVTHNDLPSFGDLQTKVAWASKRGPQVTIFGLSSRESTDALFSGQSPGDHIGVKDASRNDLVSVTFAAPIGRRVTTKSVVSWYRFDDALDVDGSARNEAKRSNQSGADAFGQTSIVFTRDVGVEDASVRQELSVVASRRQTIDTGIEAHVLGTNWGWRIAGDRNADEANGSSVLGGAGLPDLLDSSADSARGGAWIEDDIRMGSRVRVVGGLRADWNGISSETVALPRLRVLFTIAPGTTIRLATGLYTQSPGYEKLLQADYFVDLSHATDLGLKSERSRHVVVGLEHEFSRAVTGRVEAYDKSFDRMIVGRLETPAETAARVAEYAFPPDLSSSVPTAPQITSVPTNAASGDAYGFDVYLQKRATGPNDRLTGWASYTWGRAFIDSYGRRYPFDYDRRHALSVVTMWRMSRRVDIGATWRLASGFPETTPIGLRVASALADGATAHAPGSLVPARDASGALEWTIDNGGVDQLNTSRLPVFARLDLRMTFMPSRASRWQLYVEAINALNRDNAGALRSSLKFDPTSDRPKLTFSRDEGLPLLPSFGLRIKF